VPASGAAASGVLPEPPPLVATPLVATLPDAPALPPPAPDPPAGAAVPEPPPAIPEPLALPDVVLEPLEAPRVDPDAFCGLVLDEHP